MTATSVTDFIVAAAYLTWLLVAGVGAVFNTERVVTG